MKKNIFLPLLLILAACSSSKYSVDTYIPEKADYSQYKTFGYADMSSGLSEEATNKLSALLQAQSAINNEMSRRGFSFAPQGTKPDLLVNIGTLVKQKKDITVTGIAVYPERDMMYWGAVDYNLRYDPETYQTVVSTKEYQEGSLLVDIVDVKKKILLWHGVVSKALQQGDIQTQADPMSKPINLLFDKFPVKPLK